MNRVCPSCKNKIEYKSYKVFWKANKHNSTCRPCFYKSLNGKKHSEETKRKIGDANKISLLGNIPAHKGLPMSEEQKIKLSIIRTGKKASEITKQKHRIDRLKRILNDGIPLNEDRGARKFFNEWNNNNNSNFKPKTFWKLGYIADGYDEDKHIWIEFDPPHHYYINGVLKPKDIIRQNNIINYFKTNEHPLNKFIRVKSTKMGDVLSINEVYNKGEQ